MNILALIMEEKKQIEKLLVEGFRKFFPDFPAGRLVSSESPDFILRMKNNHYLGIELTRLHPENSNNINGGVKIQAKTEERIVENAREIFSYTSVQPLFVKFQFSSDHIISEEIAVSTSALAVQAIRKKVSRMKGERFTSILIPSQDLPAGINSVLILHHPALESPVWEKANNLGVSNDIISDLRFSILKKDEKLKLYHRRKLHLYWLLITTDRLQGISSFNIEYKIMNHSFNSGFQHVFLYELMKERIYRLV